MGLKSYVPIFRLSLLPLIAVLNVEQLRRCRVACLADKFAREQHRVPDQDILVEVQVDVGGEVQFVADVETSIAFRRYALDGTASAVQGVFAAIEIKEVALQAAGDPLGRVKI